MFVALRSHAYDICNAIPLLPAAENELDAKSRETAQSRLYSARSPGDTRFYNLAQLKKIVWQSTYETLAQARNLLDAISPYFNQQDRDHLNDLFLWSAETGNVDFARYLISKGVKVQPTDIVRKILSMLQRIMAILKWSSFCSMKLMSISVGVVVRN